MIVNWALAKLKQLKQDQPDRYALLDWTGVDLGIIDEMFPCKDGCGKLPPPLRYQKSSHHLMLWRSLREQNQQSWVDGEETALPPVGNRPERMTLRSQSRETQADENFIQDGENLMVIDSEKECFPEAHAAQATSEILEKNTEGDTGVIQWGDSSDHLKDELDCDELCAESSEKRSEQLQMLRIKAAKAAEAWGNGSSHEDHCKDDLYSENLWQEKLIRLKAFVAKVSSSVTAFYSTSIICLTCNHFKHGHSNIDSVSFRAIDICSSFPRRILFIFLFRS